MAPRTVYANLTDGLQPFSLFDQSLADMGGLGAIPCTATGTNAIVLTPIASAYAPAIATPPQQLQVFTFVATASSTGAVTVNGLKLYKEDGATQASTNDIIINVLYGIVYNSALNGAAGGYQIAFPITSILNPVISGATITSSTYNGLSITATTGTLTIGALKTLTTNNTLTLAGTDGTTMTFPTTSATIARTDAANTFTGHQTIEGVTSTGATGTGNLVFSLSPTFTGTAAFAALTATTVNGNTFTSGSYTLTGTAAKTLNFTNSITLSGTDSTTMTFPTTSATIARTDAGNTFTGTQNLASLTISSAVATDGSKNLVSVANTGTGNNVLATTPTINQANLVGTTTNDDAAAGSVGEYVSSNVNAVSAVALTSNTQKNVTSISLTAGDWDVRSIGGLTGGGTTTVTRFITSMTTTSAVIDVSTNDRHSDTTYNNIAPFGTANLTQSLAPARFSLAGTTTVFLVVNAIFATSTCSGFGMISARRVR